MNGLGVYQMMQTDDVICLIGISPNRVPSVIMYTDKQLRDIRHYCSSGNQVQFSGLIRLSILVASTLLRACIKMLQWWLSGPTSVPCSWVQCLYTATRVAVYKHYINIRWDIWSVFRPFRNSSRRLRPVPADSGIGWRTCVTKMYVYLRSTRCVCRLH